VTPGARRPSALGLVGLLAAGVLAAPPAAVAQIHQERLDNGLTVVVRENPVAPVVAVSLLVKMGTRWEQPATAGISNFVHAVMVKGTAKRSGAELAEAVAALGGKISATGEVDYSEIRASALARFWRDLLGLVAELALEPKLLPDEVDRERDWLLSRVQKRRDNAPSRAFDAFYATLYGSHPYALPALGTPQSLARIDHAAIGGAYRAGYRPERMVLALSGQVAASEVLAEARRRFGGMARGGLGVDAPIPTPVASARRVELEMPAQQSQILTGSLAPPLDHPDHAAVKVLSTILGGGMAGRLFAELRDKQGLAYTATSYYDPVREPGALVLYLGTSPENAPKAEAALLAEVERIRRDPVSAEELARAKGYLLGRYAMDRRTNERLAWYLAFYDIEGQPRDFPDRYRRAVQAVSTADILRVARRYLATLTTVVVRAR
jgi:predicted Zn-dependent peptidase